MFGKVELAMTGFILLAVGAVIDDKSKPDPTLEYLGRRWPTLVLGTIVVGWIGILRCLKSPFKEGDRISFRKNLTHVLMTGTTGFFATAVLLSVYQDTLSLLVAIPVLVLFGVFGALVLSDFFVVSEEEQDKGSVKILIRKLLGFVWRSRVPESIRTEFEKGPSDEPPKSSTSSK